jgi:VHS domain
VKLEIFAFLFVCCDCIYARNEFVWYFVIQNITVEMLFILCTFFAEQATDASLASENWALNMEICDLINESSDVARDAMKAIRKRLTQNAGKNNTVIMYTLTVLETCVKNCGKAFHVLVANKEFVQELVKLIGPKNDPPAVVQEKVSE